MSSSQTNEPDPPFTVTFPDMFWSPGKLITHVNVSPFWVGIVLGHATPNLEVSIPVDLTQDKFLMAASMSRCNET